MHCVLHNLTLIDESSTLQVLSYVLDMCTFHVLFIVSIVLVSCVVKITTESCFAFSRVAKPPRIITHAQEVKDAVPGKLVTFTIVATGTEPLSYQWQYEAGSEGLQLYDVEKSPGANSSTLTIPRVKKLNEGSYYCIVSNCAGSETSKYAALSLGEYIPHGLTSLVDLQTCM